MNPIPLNDRGQFRYADFVEYAPEFLWDEPDVVELLQVMSDYINDAYRNIEDVEEFEFKLCVAEAKVNKGRKKLEKLRAMFGLASGRGERVYYLSVPRANVKSNAVFGKSGGYTPYYVDVGLREVAEEIPGAYGIDRKIGELSDGDVVFVRYMSLDPVVTKSYYYSSERGSLLLDPEGTTQDPFTDTDNSGARMISFKVDDISSVNKRLGGVVGSNSYYEVFFTARVSDVHTSAAVDTVEFDADLVNDVKDTLVVDYYGMSYVPKEKMYTTMSFYGGEGWKWKNGFPTGMFYLKDSSGAKLAAAGDSMKDNEELAVDPSLAMSSERYGLASDATYDPLTGTWSFTTTVPIPQMPGASFYVVDKKTGNRLGDFTMVCSTTIDGDYTYTMTTVWMDDSIGERISADSAFLMTFPLFYDKGVPDYESSTPLITWTPVGNMVMTDMKSTTMIRSATTSDIVMFGDMMEYTVCQSGTAPVPGCILNSYQFVVSAAVADAMLEYKETHLGLELYCGNTLWYGLVAPLSIKKDSNGSTATVSMPVTISAYEGDVQLSAGYVSTIEYIDGYGWRWGDISSEGLLPDLVYSADSPASLEGYLLAYDAGGIVHPVRITSVEDGLRLTIYAGDRLPEGQYACTIARIYKASGIASGITGVSRTGSSQYTCTVNSYDADIFTPGIFYMYDGNGNTMFVHVGDPDHPVKRFEPEVRYDAGDTVYFDGRLYECIAPCTLSGTDNPRSVSEFREDTVTGYRTGYSAMYNKFIPYYGQVQAMDYGASVDYTGDMSLATIPLYITKVVENRLKYGWEHREFLNYGTMMNMSGRDRNGSIDIFSSARSGDNIGFETTMDAVTATLESKAKWEIAYPVIKKGAEQNIRADVDNPVAVPAEGKETYWLVTVQSAAHGLVEGVQVRVTGFAESGGVNINGYRTVHVIDGDTFSFTVPADGGVTARGNVYIPVDAANLIEYVADYRLDVLGATEESTGNYKITVNGKTTGIHAGDKLSMYDLDVDTGMAEGNVSFDITVLSTEGDSTIHVSIQSYEKFVAQSSHSFQIRRPIAEDDYVVISDEVYRVSSGIWEQKDSHDMSVPSVLMSRHNLMDVSATNPDIAVGDDIEIESIYPDGPDGAIVRLNDMIAHFTPDNADIIEGRTMVYVHNVTPSQYNGWHTVTEVMSPKSFRMTARLSEGSMTEGSGINGEKMYLNEGRWYAFTVKGVDWDKISNRVTYSLNNRIVTDSADIVTEYAHGLSKGDYVVVGTLEDVTGVDYYNKDSVDIDCYVVSNVIGNTGLELEDMNGNRVSGLTGQSIARGVVLTERDDDIGSLRNEYTRKLVSLGGKAYRFRAGDIVVALAQQNPCEVKAWKVVAKSEWQPVRAKRSMKINSLGVYSYGNGAFDGTDVESDEDIEKYETYSDVDIAGFDADVYVAGYRCVSNSNFSVPSLDDMDTTRNANEEYSSAEDFSTVSPRHKMKSSFKGIPTMKYPLVEKIERLCYLRDAHVIDYDLIEYLARFMGYDITALGDDVAESNLYRTKQDRELAVRETIANLPQYYALGGTRPGLHMLMSAFGVIADAVTLWTDADYPYDELISKDEVMTRMEDGDTGKWVPTPYIDIVVTNNASLPQFSATQSDIARLKEQILVFKPINVVFRDFVYRLVDTARLNPTISIDWVSGTGNGGAVTSSGTDLEVEYSEENLNPCAF